MFNHVAIGTTGRSEYEFYMLRTTAQVGKKMSGSKQKMLVLTRLQDATHAERS